MILDSHHHHNIFSCFCEVTTMRLLLLGVSLLIHHVAADLVLSERIMKLSRTAAELSALAYEEDPPPDPRFGLFGYYDSEPDQALLVSTSSGYCIAAFRGTTLTWDDWSQNLKLGTNQICPEYSDSHCCTTRAGFWEAYDTAYRHELEAAIRNCTKTCDSPDECLVLTGHSQGGAIAAVAGVVLSDLNPIVITFGQPPTIDSPCPLISSERWYRYVNTKSTEKLTIGIVYDPVPFAPGLGADFFGHMILLSDDSSGVAYIGLDSQDFFGPLNVAGVEAHSMIATTEHPGYLDRIEAIFNHTDASFPIRTSGYLAGSLCTQNSECESEECGKELLYSWKRCVGIDCDNDDDCTETGRCDSGVCIPKLGSCQECDEHSDCESGICSWKFKCTNQNGLMDDNCDCNFNHDCESGRCEGFTQSICEAPLSAGSPCNENSDCVSGSCSWRYKCNAEPTRWWWSPSPAPETTVTATSRSIGIPTEEEDSGSFPSIWVWILIAIGVLAVGLGLQACFQNRRRRGYEEIPARLIV